VTRSEARAAANARALAGPENTGSFAGDAARGGAIAFGGQISRLLLQLVGTAIMSRLLAPEDFGLIAMAVTVTGFVAMFTDMGLSVATIQRSEVTQPLVSTLLFVNVGVGLILLLLAALAAPLAALLYSDPRVTWLVIGMALSIPMAAAVAQHNALLARSMRWMPLQIIAVASQAIGLVVGVLLAWKTDAGVWALVAQMITASVATLILTWIVCDWRPSRVDDWRVARTELGFGANVTGFSLLNFLHRQFDNVLIGWRWGAVELGFYARAYNLLTLPIGLINGSLSSSAIPILSKCKDDPERWNAAYLRLATVTAYMGCGLCAVLFVIAEPLVTIILGPGWNEVSVIFRVLAVSSIFGTASNSCGWVFISLGRTRQYFYWSLFGCPLYALSFLIGLPWKAEGVAIGYAICVFALTPLYFGYAMRQTTIAMSTLSRWMMPVLLVAMLAIGCGELVNLATVGSHEIVRIVIGGGVVGTVYVALGAACLYRLSHYRPMQAMLHELLAPLTRRFGGKSGA
jgi:polysaccharide transporter, PST family